MIENAQDNTLQLNVAQDVQYRSSLFNDLTDEVTPARSSSLNQLTRQDGRNRVYSPHHNNENLQNIVSQIRDQQAALSRLQESLFSQILVPSISPNSRGALGGNFNQTGASFAHNIFPQHGGHNNHNNTTAVQTFEDSKGIVGVVDEEDTDEVSDQENHIDIVGTRNQLAVQKEQLEVARSLILKQKSAMMAMTLKMREMNSELKRLKVLQQRKVSCQECYGYEAAEVAVQTQDFAWQGSIHVASSSVQLKNSISIDYCTSENNENCSDSQNQGTQAPPDHQRRGENNNLQTASQKQSSQESPGKVVKCISMNGESSLETLSLPYKLPEDSIGSIVAVENELQGPNQVNKKSLKVFQKDSQIEENHIVRVTEVQKQHPILICDEPRNGESENEQINHYDNSDSLQCSPLKEIQIPVTLNKHAEHYRVREDELVHIKSLDLGIEKIGSVPASASVSELVQLSSIQEPAFGLRESTQSLPQYGNNNQHSKEITSSEIYNQVIYTSNESSTTTKDDEKKVSVQEPETTNDKVLVTTTTNTQNELTSMPEASSDLTNICQNHLGKLKQKNKAFMGPNFNHNVFKIAEYAQKITPPTHDASKNLQAQVLYSSEDDEDVLQDVPKLPQTVPFKDSQIRNVTKKRTMSSSTSILANNQLFEAINSEKVNIKNSEARPSLGDRQIEDGELRQDSQDVKFEENQPSQLNPLTQLSPLKCNKEENTPEIQHEDTVSNQKQKCTSNRVVAEVSPIAHRSPFKNSVVVENAKTLLGLGRINSRRTRTSCHVHGLDEKENHQGSLVERQFSLLSGVEVDIVHPNPPTLTQTLHQHSNFSHSLRSFSAQESQIVSSNREDYWVKRVDKLMQDRRQVIKLIKDKNSEIRAATKQNQKLAQALKQKQELIDTLQLEQAKKMHHSKKLSYHFQEVSDIISEEDESLNGNAKRTRESNRQRLSAAPIMTQPLLTPSPQLQKQGVVSFKAIQNGGEAIMKQVQTPKRFSHPPAMPSQAVDLIEPESCLSVGKDSSVGSEEEPYCAEPLSSNPSQALNFKPYSDRWAKPAHSNETDVYKKMASEIFKNKQHPPVNSIVSNKQLTISSNEKVVLLASGEVSEDNENGGRGSQPFKMSEPQTFICQPSMHHQSRNDGESGTSQTDLKSQLTRNQIMKVQLTSKSSNQRTSMFRQGSHRKIASQNNRMLSSLLEKSVSPSYDLMKQKNQKQNRNSKDLTPYASGNSRNHCSTSFKKFVNSGPGPNRVKTQNNSGLQHNSASFKNEQTVITYSMENPGEDSVYQKIISTMLNGQPNAGLTSETSSQHTFKKTNNHLTTAQSKKSHHSKTTSNHARKSAQLFGGNTNNSSTIPSQPVSSLKTPNQKLTQVKSMTNRMTPFTALNYLKPTNQAASSGSHSKKPSILKTPTNLNGQLGGQAQVSQNEGIYAVEGKMYTAKSSLIEGDLAVPHMQVSQNNNNRLYMGVNRAPAKRSPVVQATKSFQQKSGVSPQILNPKAQSQVSSHPAGQPASKQSTQQQQKKVLKKHKNAHSMHCNIFMNGTPLINNHQTAMEQHAQRNSCTHGGRPSYEAHFDKPTKQGARAAQGKESCITPRARKTNTFGAMTDQQ